MSKTISKNVTVLSARDDIVEIRFYERDEKSFIQVITKNGSYWNYEIKCFSNGEKTHTVCSNCGNPYFPFRDEEYNQIDDHFYNPYVCLDCQKKEKNTKPKTIEIDVQKANYEIRSDIDYALRRLSHAKEEYENNHNYGMSHVSRNINKYIASAKEYYYYAYGKASILGEANVSKENLADLKKLFDELRC